MCGIAGILSSNGDPHRAALLSMRAALQHRGPDDDGLAEIALSGGLALGLVQTRLSILDISSTGHQPMADAESGSWIAYNGEVYNHLAIRRQLGDCTFQGTSDTETVLKGWVRKGDAVLGDLRGMFALALYDGARRQFWLVRDRLGVKPLYVCQATPQTWVFASEVRALLASGLVARRLDAAAIDSYLAFGAVPAPRTLVDGVHSLLPGEAWRFDLDTDARPLTPKRLRYWRPAFSAAAKASSNGSLRVPARQEVVEKLRGVLQEAVALRMLSDVPVGVFLSGGIDSGAVVATLASQGYKLRTFSVSFGESQFDESEHARCVARCFGTEHTELLLEPAKVLEEFDQALDAYDQPSIDGFNTYFISQATRQAGVKVALSGLGGDELFAGYPHFRYLARLEGPVQRGLARVLHGLLRLVNPGAMRTQKLGELLSGGRSRLENYAICRQVMLGGRREALLRRREQVGNFPLPAEVVADLQQATAGLDPINAHSLLELSLYMGNMLLRDTDQMSMAHALEVREPLLDHVLVDTVAGLPGCMKMAPGRQFGIKGLLLDALPAPLPDQVLRRRKMGFVFPWEHWLRHELRPRVTDVLTDEDALDAAGINSQAVTVLWQGFLAGQPGLRYTDVLCLLNLLAWVKRHIMALQPAA